MSGETNSVVRYAKVYDRIEDGRPGFEGRERLEGAERAAVVKYLYDGEVLVRTSEREVDLIDPSRGEAIRDIVQSDGKWIWSDATIYYLEQYGWAPEPEFLAHIRGRDYTYVEPTDEEVSWATDVVLNNEW